MKVTKTILNIAVLIVGIVFLVIGGSDIQIGFGITLIAIAGNGLLG